MKSILFGAAVALALGAPSFAQQNQPAREISAPIVAFTPVIVKNADALELTEAQRADLKQWLDTMPANRKMIEEAALAARDDCICFAEQPYSFDDLAGAEHDQLPRF